jgi:hypothetical protein
MAEFKIGSLRYTWKGTWTTSTFYNRDSVVHYNGKTYLCLIPHTSTDFYTDIERVGGDGSLTPYWEIMIEGRTWKNAWQADTYYSLGNLVVYGGAVYACTTHHTSGLTFDATKWSTFAKADHWVNAWAVSTTYKIGEVISYGGIVYRCIANHVSAASIDDGLEVDQASWETVYNGVTYLGEFAVNVRYKLNDIVKLDSELYICTTPYTAVETTVTLNNTTRIETFDPTKWTVWQYGEVYRGEWNNTTIYQKNDIVTYGGHAYRNLNSNSVNIIPALPQTSQQVVIEWEAVALGWNVKGNWDSTTTYYAGDVVARGSRLYYATLTSTNADPTDSVIEALYTAAGSSGTTIIVSDPTSGQGGGLGGISLNLSVGMVVIGTGFTLGQTIVQVVDANTVVLNAGPDGTLVDGQTLSFVGVNTPMWKILTPGMDWKSFWVSDNDYIIGDVVVRKNGTYQCIQNHTSDITNRPDVSATFWQIYSLHDRRNALAEQGDTVYFDGNNTQAISIGLQDQLLRATSGTPQWKKVLSLPQLYYVSDEIGVDAAGYGDTWDKPYRTVKYACDQVRSGFYYPAARYLISANKDWMVEEMYRWMLYQSANTQAPFFPTSVFQEAATYRDAKIIVNAVVYDISRGGNSQTVAAALRYFADSSETEFFNAATDAAQPYIVASLIKLKELMGNALTQTAPALNYQNFAGIALVDQKVQTIDLNVEAEAGTWTEVQSLMDIVITAVNIASTRNLPQPNQGMTATINIKTGTYEEDLPIIIPDNTAIVGDELRGAVIRPSNAVYTEAIASDNNTTRITLKTIEGLTTWMPIQFAVSGVNNMFGIFEYGRTYYVESIDPTNNTITVATMVNGAPVSMGTGQGLIKVYAGNCLKDMFYVRNGSGIRNMTLTGLAGTLTEPNQFLTRRPTGGSFVSLDPGAGPDDASVWILKRSPYIQNVTTFGVGATGLKIDGTLHNGGNKSIVANDFTQIISDGFGCWCTGPGALTELVSVFSYYGYAGYMAEDGGKIRATNGNSSYGTFGVIAEGYDVTEVPISGVVDNQSTQVQASVQSSFGISAQLLKMQYGNAGAGYYEETTNLLKNSNNFVDAVWATDSNVTVLQNSMAPTGYAEAWSLIAATSSTDSSYMYQDVVVSPPGAVYTNMPGLNVSGSGTSATFDITVGSTGYLASVNTGGTGYVIGNVIRISGSQLGGRDIINDCFLTVDTLFGSAVLTVTVDGIVPVGSNQAYTFSVYAQKSTATAFEIDAVFSGVESVTSSIIYSFAANTVTPGNIGNGMLPTEYGALELPNGWYRVWFSFYDSIALNTALRVKIYPRGKTNPAGITKFYGTQLQYGNAPTFYLETDTNRFTAHANYKVSGAGLGAKAVGDELRSNAIHETRVTDTGTGVGGASYLTSSNNAQGGTSRQVIIAGSDTNTANNYVGMRVFINSGTGAGQYGYISTYTPVSKVVQVLKESFATLRIAGTDNATGLFTLGTGYNTKTLYTNQPVQFIPTYYTTNVTETSADSVTVTAAEGGDVDRFTVASTAKLEANMQVYFDGTTFGGVITAFPYYVKEVISSTQFTITTELFGTTWNLVTGVGSMTMKFDGGTNFITGSTTNMAVNMPIQFTGTSIGGITDSTTYYINEIISANKFTISSTLIEKTVTSTTAITNEMTVADATTLVPLTPVLFSGVTYGGVDTATTYYISKIISTTNFTVASSIITTAASASEVTSNLITVTSTAGFIPGNPIMFYGNTFGGITNGVVYYILAVNDNTTFTISLSSGGSAVNLTTAIGDVIVRTTGVSATLTSASGAMTLSTTSAKAALTVGYGAMNATFSTKLIGNVSSSTVYYVRTINSNSFTVSENVDGSAITLKTDVGSMNVAAAGWDHINPGTQIEPTLDSSSVYYIEPRVTYTSPGFTQTTSTIGTLAVGTNWIDIAYGNNAFVAIPSGNNTAAVSTNGTTWTAMTLPTSTSWTGIAYGDGHWVIVSANGPSTASGSIVLTSNSNGLGWRVRYLPSKSSWSEIAYGNGVFVSIATGTANAAYSTDYGVTWNSATGLPNSTWSGLIYGAGKFVAVASGSDTGAYSTDGVTWTTMTLPASSAWADVAYGNNVFVAVSNTTAPVAYSTDGITWYSSKLQVAADELAYGQGVFFAAPASGTTGFTSDDGLNWVERTISNIGYDSIAFGYDPDDNYVGRFVTVAGTNKTSYVSAGATTKGRAVIASGKIKSISEWEPGSGYASMPSVTLTDPNVTKLATFTLRRASGTLGNPTFVNRGEGYNTTSTKITVNGGGYADSYQVGLTITVKNLSALPRPGDDLVIDGNSKIYKVTDATAVFGTTAPYIKANISIGPEMTTALSPANGAVVTIRQKYSQCRLTNHDFLNIGYGNFEDSNYPNEPANTILATQDQAIEANFGRVFYTSTDQDGNFRVGNLFAVEQATGIVTLSASQFGLTGLETLQLGGIAVGGSSVVIRQFSTDPTFVANSNEIVSTQKAIKSYLQGRLSQGGSNTFTGQLIASSVLVGGPDKIASTIPRGVQGSVIKMADTVHVNGPYAGWDGNGMAYSFFVKSWVRPGAL